MRLRQSRTIKAEQCSLEPIYKGTGPDTSVPDRLPVISGCNKVLSQRLQCYQIVAFTTPIAKSSDVWHYWGQMLILQFF